MWNVRKYPTMNNRITRPDRRNNNSAGGVIPWGIIRTGFRSSSLSNCGTLANGGCTRPETGHWIPDGHLMGDVHWKWLKQESQWTYLSILTMVYDWIWHINNAGALGKTKLLGWLLDVLDQIGPYVLLDANGWLGLRWYHRPMSSKSQSLSSKL